MNSILTWLADLFQALLRGSKREINNLEVNLKNAHKRLEVIQNNYYPKFERDAQHFLSREGALWFVRKDLEAARYYYSGGREGYPMSDRVEDTFKLHLIDPRFRELKDLLSETECKVAEMEAAKGYEFVSVDNNNIIFRDVATGTVLSPADSSHI